MANKVDWDKQIREAEATLAEAEKKLAEFEASPDGLALKAAEEAETRAKEARDDASHRRYAVAREASVRLGIRLSAEEGGLKKYDQLNWAPGFLAAAAEQIGCTYAEAESMPGMNSFHGSRVTGQELYDGVLNVIEDRILEKDAAVIAAKAEYKIAQERAGIASMAEDSLSRQHSIILRGPMLAKDALGRVQREKREAEGRRVAAEERKAAQKAPEVVTRLARAKEKLIKLDAKHRDLRQKYGITRPGEPVDWWPPQPRAEPSQSLDFPMLSQDEAGSHEEPA